MMQSPRLLLSIFVGVSVGCLLCNGERADDWWLQEEININDHGSCFELKPCTITYLRSHEVSSEKLKASTMYQCCLVPPDGTTVLPLEIWYFQNGNKSFPDCHQGRGDTNHNRFRISQNGSNENIVFECNDGRIDKMLINVSFTKPPLIFTHLTGPTGPVDEKGFLFKIDLSKDPQCSLPSPVHGGLSCWSTLSDCTVSCGGGTQYRQRMCDSPTPEHGGEDCDGDLIDIAQCNSQPCDGSKSRGKPENGWKIATIVLAVSVVFIAICFVGRCVHEPVKIKLNTSDTRTDPDPPELSPRLPSPRRPLEPPPPPPGPNIVVERDGRQSENVAMTHSDSYRSSLNADWAPAGQLEQNTVDTQLPNVQREGNVEADNNIISSASTSSLDPIETSQLLSDEPNSNAPSTSGTVEDDNNIISSASSSSLDPIETSQLLPDVPNSNAPSTSAEQNNMLSAELVCQSATTQSIEIRSPFSELRPQPANAHQ